jgi:predicted secreted Zn-dependent protease
VQQPPWNQPGWGPAYPQWGPPAQPPRAPPPPKSQTGLIVAIVLAAAVLFLAVGVGVGYVLVARTKQDTEESDTHETKSHTRAHRTRSHDDEKEDRDDPAPTASTHVAPSAPSRTHDPRVAVSVVHDDYKITGNTAAGLRQQMNADGPLDHDKHFDAHTEWNVRWTYPFDRSGGGCSTGPVTVTLTITYHFPEWGDESDGSRPLIDKWHKYLQALETHEDGHAEHGREAADDIIGELSGLPPADACPTMDGIANAKAQAIIGRYAAEDVDYDRDTNHGATQGATFP